MIDKQETIFSNNDSRIDIIRISPDDNMIVIGGYNCDSF
jgi:hypothetical protein